MIASYTVSGMTCGNCVKHVTEEVSEIPGVTSVDIVLEGGLMTVESDEALDFAAIEEAVSEAGDQYTVTPA